MSETRLP